MSKGDSMKKISITWDDLRDIPSEDFEAGRVAITGLEGGDVPVLYTDLENRPQYLMVAPNGGVLYRGTFDALGLGIVREVEEHQHGLIPEEPWAHIVLGGGRHGVLGDPEDPNPWLTSYAGSYDWWSRPRMQAVADEHGFEVLVPESRIEEAREEGREEGRLAGIREAHDSCRSQVGLIWAEAASAQIERTFPEAFEAEEGDR